MKLKYVFLLLMVLTFSCQVDDPRPDLPNDREEINQQVTFQIEDAIIFGPGSQVRTAELPTLDEFVVKIKILEWNDGSGSPYITAYYDYNYLLANPDQTILLETGNTYDISMTVLPKLDQDQINLLSDEGYSTQTVKVYNKASPSESDPFEEITIIGDFQVAPDFQTDIAFATWIFGLTSGFFEPDPDVVIVLASEDLYGPTALSFVVSNPNGVLPGEIILLLEGGVPGSFWEESVTDLPEHLFLFNGMNRISIIYRSPAEVDTEVAYKNLVGNQLDPLAHYNVTLVVPEIIVDGDGELESFSGPGTQGFSFGLPAALFETQPLSVGD